MRVTACLAQNRGNNSFTLLALLGILPPYIVGAVMQIVGKRNGFLSTVAVLAVVLGSSASGQALRNAGGPAETPPANFSGNQFVDSNGCVFVRAGIGGTTSWVPRVSRTRQQLCGFQPTLSGGTVALAPLRPLPSPETPAAEPAVTAQAQPEPAPAPVRTPAPAPVQVASPAQTTPAPTVSRPVPAAAPAPTVIAARPSPQVIVPQAAPTPRVLTRAEACEGLTGIQPNLIGQRSGRPIDCGGSAPVQQVATVAPAPVAAPQPVVAAPAQRRLSRAEACAAMSASGRQYISTTTGLPLQCAPQAQTTTGLGQLQADLRRPQAPYSNPLDSAPGTFATPERIVISNATWQAPYSNVLDSAPGSVSTTNTQFASAAAVAPRPQAPTLLQSLTGQRPAPYSNPTHAQALAAPSVPSGYDRVWSDGRLNTQRGLPAATQTTSYAKSPAPQVQAPATTTRAAAPTPARPQVEQISGHRYVQVGTFGTRDQAQSIARALRSRGLPMRVGVYNQQGREMRIVLAGPFANDSQLQSALNTTRGAGFSGAFTRR